MNVSPPGGALVLVGAPLHCGLPFRVVPGRPGVVLADEARARPDLIRDWLHRSGAVLFRGFAVTLDTFADVARALAGELAPYVERSSPRTRVRDRVYTATDHPSDQVIGLHHENSYQRVFPRFLVFGCLVTPTAGGATPLADARRVLAQIPEPVREPFLRHGVCYVRNFSEGLGLSWQEAFQTTSRAEVEQYCADRDIAVRWRPDGGLRTRQVRPAVARHPVTGELCWFNHALFFNAAGLPASVRGALVNQLGEDGLPNQTYYGDGRRIPDDVLRTLAESYAAERVAVPWQSGDVLLVDNLLAAHGREPFTGARQVVVGMAGPTSWTDVGTGGGR